jgi:hypothetical protein
MKILFRSLLVAIITGPLFIQPLCAGGDNGPTRSTNEKAASSEFLNEYQLIEDCQLRGKRLVLKSEQKSKQRSNIKDMFPTAPEAHESANNSDSSLDKADVSTASTPTSEESSTNLPVVTNLQVMNAKSLTSCIDLPGDASALADELAFLLLQMKQKNKNFQLPTVTISPLPYQKVCLMDVNKSYPADITKTTSTGDHGKF